jgi:hypothetical protein
MASHEVRYICFSFICGLFNNAVSRSGNTASSGRMINEQWIGKDMEGSGRGLI